MLGPTADLINAAPVFLQGRFLFVEAIQGLLRNGHDLRGQKGGSLTLSDDTADIDSGFILRYGGIEENCSLKALFADRQEELQDLVHKLLF